MRITAKCHLSAIGLLALISGPSFAATGHPPWSSKDLRPFDHSEWCSKYISMYKEYPNNTGHAIAVTVQTLGTMKCVVALYAGSEKVGYAFKHGNSDTQMCMATIIVPSGVNYCATFDDGRR